MPNTLETHHESPEPLILPNLEQVKKLMQEAEVMVEQGFVPNKEGFICGDGRYGKKVKVVGGAEIEVEGMPGVLGEDLGLLAGILKARVDLTKTDEEIHTQVKVITKEYVDAIIKLRGKFHLHTDKHASHNESGATNDIGCGYYKNVMKTADSEIFSVALEYVRELKQLEEYKDLIVEKELDGDHREKSVVSVSSTTHSLIHEQVIDGNPYQVFSINPVIAKARNLQTLDELNITDETTRDTILKHVADFEGSILRKLAVGLALFDVDENKILSFKGIIVPDDEKGITLLTQGYEELTAA